MLTKPGSGVEQIFSSHFGEFIDSFDPTVFYLSGSHSSLDLLAHAAAAVYDIERQFVMNILVRRLLPLEVVWIESANGADYGRACDDWFENLAVSDVYLNSSANLTRELMKCRLEMRGTKGDARQIVLLQF